MSGMKMNDRWQNKKRIAVDYLLIMLIACICIVMIMVIVTEGQVLEKILFAQQYGFTTPFMDFFGPVTWHYLPDNPYTIQGSVYPALGMLFYRFLARCLSVAEQRGQTELMMTYLISLIHAVQTMVRNRRSRKRNSESIVLNQG